MLLRAAARPVNPPPSRTVGRPAGPPPSARPPGPPPNGRPSMPPPNHAPQPNSPPQQFSVQNINPMEPTTNQHYQGKNLPYF